MAQIPESSDTFRKLVSRQAFEVAEDFEVLLRNYELFKIAIDLLEDKIINLDHPKATGFLELLDCFGSRSDSFLENLQASVKQLLELIAAHR
jgi:hypothetical protein